MGPDDRLLSNAEVAQMLNIPLKTLEKWRYEGTGPVGFRVGRHVRYHPAAVRQWLNEKAGLPDAVA